jgi:hypothetical protein
MERLATPGMNWQNLNSVVMGVTTYCSEGNSPLPADYGVKENTRKVMTKYHQKKCRDIVDKNLHKEYRGDKKGKKYIRVRERNYDHETLQNKLYEAIDLCDMDELKTAQQRFKSLTMMSFVRFLIEIIDY